MRPVALLLNVALAAVACDDNPAPGSPPPRAAAVSSLGCTRSGAPRGVLSGERVEVKGNARTYDLVVPTAASSTTPLPLVFVFHDDPGDARAVRQAYDVEGAAQGGAIFVYPDALAGGWDLERSGATNLDILTFDAIKDDVLADQCVDVKRVYVAGFGEGGSFAEQLGCRRGSVIRAIAAHSGKGPTGGPPEYTTTGELTCPEQAVAALVVHGAADEVVKAAEGQRSSQHWRRVNGCRSGSGDAIDPAPCTALAGCATERPVVSCEVPGLGHEVWPLAARATWQFFARF